MISAAIRIALLCLFAVNTAWGQTSPTRPIRMIIQIGRAHV